MPNTIDPTAQALIDSGEYRLGQECAPKPYKESKEEAFRNATINLLDDKTGLFITSVSDEGWPTGEVAQYITLVGEDGRPVLLIFPESSGQTVANIRANPRVSIATQHAVSFEQMREAKGLQIQATASVVDLESDTLGEFRTDEDRTTFENVDFATQTAIRIDALSAVFFDASGRPQWGQIDYYAD